MFLKNTLSPFRYPGGKTWLIPYVRRWLNSLERKPQKLVEPFAGGGSVGLAVADEGLVEYVTLVEIDEAVASVWRVVINGDGDVQLLINRIKNFVLTERTVDLELSQQSISLNDLAFQTILRNRINRGGIIAPGAGRLKKGEDGRGLTSRWYPETLSRRITRIVELRPIVSFIQGDGLQMIESSASSTDHVFFIDPPYTAGKRLYTCPTIDHETLFCLVAEVQGDFLMTYDTNPEVRRLASLHCFDTHEISMTNTHNSKRTELLIGKDLTWIRQSVVAKNQANSDQRYEPHLRPHQQPERPGA